MVRKLSELRKRHERLEKIVAFFIFSSAFGGIVLVGVMITTFFLHFAKNEHVKSDNMNPPPTITVMVGEEKKDEKR